MILNDYLLRMIDLLVKAMARVIFRKERREFPEAREELSSACRALLGLEHDLMLRMPDGALMELLGSDPDLSAAKCYVAGMLIREEANVTSLQDDDSAAPSLRLRALSLLLRAHSLAEGSLSEAHGVIIDELIEALPAVPIPLSVRVELLGYHERSGRYARAEDQVFRLVEEDPSYLSTGLSFYERLSQKNDEELSRGDLPRNEVDEGLAALKERTGAQYRI